MTNVRESLLVADNDNYHDDEDELTPTRTISRPPALRRPPPPAAVSSKSNTARSLLLVGLGLTAGGLGGGSVYGLAEHLHEPAPVAIQLPHLRPAPLVQPAAPQAPAPVTAAPAPAAAEALAPPAQVADEDLAEAPPEPAARRAVRHGSGSRGSSERALLSRARVQLKAGDPIGAQASLEQLAKRFPDSDLIEQRELLHIQTLKLLGQREAAQRAARVFAAEHPDSRHVASLQSLLLAL